MPAGRGGLARVCGAGAGATSAALRPACGGCGLRTGGGGGDVAGAGGGDRWAGGGGECGGRGGGCGAGEGGVGAGAAAERGVLGAGGGGRAGGVHGDAGDAVDVGGHERGAVRSVRGAGDRGSVQRVVLGADPDDGHVGQRRAGHGLAGRGDRERGGAGDGAGAAGHRGREQPDLGRDRLRGRGVFRVVGGGHGAVCVAELRVLDGPGGHGCGAAGRGGGHRDGGGADRAGWPVVRRSGDGEHLGGGRVRNVQRVWQQISGGGVVAAAGVPGAGGVRLVAGDVHPGGI